MVAVVLTDAARELLGRVRAERHEVVIDAGVAATQGEDSFSCESELGMRFSLDRLPRPAASGASELD